MELILLALDFFLGGLLVELFLLHCSKTRMKWLRFLPLTAVAWLWVSAWQNYHHSHALFIGLNEFSALADIIAGLLILLGWGIAWGIYKRKKYKK